MTDLEDRSLISAVHLWLRAPGIAQRVDVRPPPVSILEFDLIDPQTGAKRDLTSVGVGACQVLPVIVICLLLARPEISFSSSNLSFTFTPGRSRSSATFSLRFPKRVVSSSWRDAQRVPSIDCAGRSNRLPTSPRTRFGFVREAQPRSNRIRGAPSQPPWYVRRVARRVL